MKALKEYKIEILVDVRTRPTGEVSFREKALRNTMERKGVEYLWLGANFLGLSAIREKDTAWILQATSL